MGYAQELDDAFIDGETANIARAIGAKADAEIAALRAAPFWSRNREQSSSFHRRRIR